MCAPPLLKRTAVVGGTLEMLRGEMPRGTWRARRRASSAGDRSAVRTVCAPTGLFGKGGRPGYAGEQIQSNSRAPPQGSRSPRRYILASQAARCWSSLMEANRSHTAARLLQPCPRRRCRPAPAAGGAFRRLMGPKQSRPSCSWHLKIWMC